MLHRLGLVTGQGGHERADDPGVQPGQAATPAGKSEELSGHRAIGPHRGRGAVAGLQPRPEPGHNVGLAGGQLVHGAGITTQHRAMDCEVIEHLRDAEQVHIGRLERAGMLLVEEAAAGLVDPRHSQIQREFLHPTGGEKSLQAAPAAPVPDHRRGLIAQTHQLGIQAGHQFGNSHHDS